jgi:hypothetical protein
LEEDGMESFSASIFIDEFGASLAETLQSIFIDKALSSRSFSFFFPLILKFHKRRKGRRGNERFLFV